MRSSQGAVLRLGRAPVASVVAAAAVVVLAGCAPGDDAKDAASGRARSDELTAAFAAAGRPPPSRALVEVLGDDGGTVCAAPNGTLTQAGPDGTMVVGSTDSSTLEPVTVKSLGVQGERIIITTYCRDKLGAFDAYVANPTGG